MAYIKYDSFEAARAVKESSQRIAKRYGELKSKMLNQVAIEELRRAKTAELQQLLTQLNESYSKYTPDQVENLLATYADEEIVKNFNNYLTQIVTNQSAFRADALINEEAKKIHSQRMTFFSGLSNLFRLYQQINQSGSGVSIDMNSFKAECQRILVQIKDNPQGLSETGNILGRVGAMSGAITASFFVDKVIQQSIPAKSSSTTAITYSTGDLKDQNNRTIVTDTLTIATRQLANGSAIQCNFHFSDKFNAKFAPNPSSTQSSVKLVTRNVRTFLNEVDNQYVDDYATVLYNYLSYHEMINNDHFFRIHWLSQKDASDTEWLSFRKAVGAELMYNLTQGINSNQFSLNGQNFNDIIHIYVYGNKLFLEDKIFSSLMTKRGRAKDFNAAQISLAQTKKLLTSASNQQSRPVATVLKEREEGAESILSTSAITYKQTIKF